MACVSVRIAFPSASLSALTCPRCGKSLTRERGAKEGLGGCSPCAREHWLPPPPPPFSLGGGSWLWYASGGPFASPSSFEEGVGHGRPIGEERFLPRRTCRETGRPFCAQRIGERLERERGRELQALGSRCGSTESWGALFEGRGARRNGGQPGRGTELDEAAGHPRSWRSGRGGASLLHLPKGQRHGSKLLPVSGESAGRGKGLESWLIHRSLKVLPWRREGAACERARESLGGDVLDVSDRDVASTRTPRDSGFRARLREWAQVSPSPRCWTT